MTARTAIDDIKNGKYPELKGLEGPSNPLWDAYNTISQDLSDVEKVIVYIENVIQRFVGWVGTAVPAVADWLSTTIPALADWIGNTVPALADWIGRVVPDVANWIGRVVPEVTSWIGYVANRILDWFEDPNFYNNLLLLGWFGFGTLILLDILPAIISKS